MSEVAEHFRETVSADLDAEHQEALPVAAGTGAARELRRAMHLVDRAVRQWAHQAALLGRNEKQSAYGRLPTLTPEPGPALRKAANSEQKRGLDTEYALIAEMVWGIGERLVGIDPEAPSSTSQDALNHRDSGCRDTPGDRASRSHAGLSHRRSERGAARSGTE